MPIVKNETLEYNQCHSSNFIGGLFHEDEAYRCFEANSKC